MTSDPNRDIRAILSDKSRVQLALRRGVAEALWRHKRLGQSITVWQDGRVVRLSAEEIPDLPLDGGPAEDASAVVPADEMKTSADDADGRR